MKSIFLRAFVLMILLSACRSGEIACPGVKSVRLNKRPHNYMKHAQRYTASARETEKEKPKRIELRNTRPVKSADSIEEWDCPRPGTKNAMPKSVKENIKRNRKKFDEYYKSREVPDSVQTKGSR